MHVVAIIGRPNVGKSTLFNRLARERIAIVQDEPGVTRDRIYVEIEWQGRSFMLMDTAGISLNPDGEFDLPVQEQIDVALQEADLILYLVDVRDGPLPDDFVIAERLRQTGKPVLLVANKVDHRQHQPHVYEFYQLGLGEPIAVSAEHGTGTGDLLDAVVAQLPATEAAREETASIRVAVVGRPNVGKSSLINRMLNEQRLVVSNVPGTTRDAVDVPWQTDEGRFTLIDTAGLRRMAKIKDRIEYYSAVRTRRALERADVAVLLLDAAEPLTEQDKRIYRMIIETGRAVVIAVNKWDLRDQIAGEEDGADALSQNLIRRLREQLLHALDAPILFISALSGRGIRRLPQAIKRVYEAYRLEVATPALNRVLQDAEARHQPPSIKGRRLRIRYATQVKQGPPTFLIFVNDPQLVTDSYRRYLENQLRLAFPLQGTPLRLVFRSDIAR